MTSEVRSFSTNVSAMASEDLRRLLWHTAYTLLAPQDVLFLVVQQWLASNPSSLERPLKQAQKHDVPLCLIISNTGKPDVYTPKPDAYVSCPLGTRVYLCEVFQDQRFWLFRGELYREGDTRLCQFCEHQLRCAVEGAPLDAFKNVDRRPPKKTNA